MANLPFVVQPRRQPIIELIGSEDSGKIEIKRLGYLTSGEKSFVQQVQQYDGGTSDIVTLSRQVARKYGLSMDKSYNLILVIISGDRVSDSSDEEIMQQIETEFAEHLTNIVRGLSATQVREDLVMAACMLRYRVDPEFDISDISGIHPDLISGLATLYRDEEKRSLDAFESLIDKEVKPESAEETEKKPSGDTKSRSRTTTTD